MKKSIIYLIISVSTGVLIGFQNCSQSGSFQSNQQESVNSLPDQEVRQAQNDCRFIGGPAIASILQNILGLPDGDVAMLNEKGEQLKSNNCKSFNHMNGAKDCFYLKEFGSELTTQLCNASTFRLVSQIYINACTESLAVDENVNRLFPKGIRDTSIIHFAFTGRVPRSDETQILTELTTDFESEQEKMTAVCAAIGSSLASINSF